MGPIHARAVGYEVAEGQVPMSKPCRCIDDSLLSRSPEMLRINVRDVNT